MGADSVHLRNLISLCLKVHPWLELLCYSHLIQGLLNSSIGRATWQNFLIFSMKQLLLIFSIERLSFHIQDLPSLFWLKSSHFIVYFQMWHLVAFELSPFVFCVLSCCIYRSIFHAELLKVFSRVNWLQSHQHFLHIMSQSYFRSPLSSLLQYFITGNFSQTLHLYGSC